MKWYKDKRWLVGTILLPVGVAGFGWLYANSSNLNSIINIPNNTGIVTQGQIGNNIIKTHSFSTTQRINTLPRSLGGKRVLNLDNVATLRLFMPNTIDKVTLILDTTPMTFSDQASNIYMEISTDLGPQYHFDNRDNKRHDIMVDGRTFTVTLFEIAKLKVQNITNPIEYVFGVSDK